MPNYKLEVSRHMYHLSRETLISLNKAYEKIFHKPEDYERVAEVGKYFIKNIPDFFVKYKIPDNLETEVLGLKFPSPLILASFESDTDIIEQYLKLGFGGAIPKTVLKERLGNPRPRLIREKRKHKVNGKTVKYECIVNAMGFNGPGVVEANEELKNSNLFSYNRPIGRSIGGNSLEEYLYVHEKVLDLQYKNRFIEIDAGCPNTPHGQDMCKNPGNLDKLLHEIRKIDDTPLFVKLSPDFDNERILELVDVITKYDNTGVTLANTRTVKCNKIKLGKGGLSGLCIKDRTLELVKIVDEHKLKNNYDLPIKAEGGLSTTEDIINAKKNGASLFGMATGVVQNIFTIPLINYELSIYQSEL